MDYYRKLISDGSDVSDMLRLHVTRAGSLAAVVRVIRHIPGFEKTTIPELIGWIAGKNKQRAYTVFQNLMGLGLKPGQLHPVAAMRAAYFQTLLKARRLIKDAGNGLFAPDHEFQEAADELETMIAQQRHEITLKMRKDRDR